MNEDKKLYRSRDDRMVSGLCGGIGKYIGTDPTVVRVVVTIASIIFTGLPIVIYLVLIMVVPLEPISGPGMSGEVIN